MRKVIFFDIDDTLVDYAGALSKSLIILRNKFFPNISTSGGFKSYEFGEGAEE